MKETDLRPPTTDDIDARSEELIDEFHNQKAECYTHFRRKRTELLNPDGSLDERKLFEGWVLQKIAGLQLHVEYYERVVNAMLRGLGRRR
jgi:hypothetical protein